MVVMRRRGCNLQEIAFALRCSQNAVSNHLQKHGLIPESTVGPRKPWRAVPQARRRRVIALRKRGYTYEKIANIVGLAPCTVRTIVITGGRPPVRKRVYYYEKTSDDKIVRIIALRRAGSSLAYIAAATGVSASTTGKILKNNGFPGKIRLLRLAGPVGSRVRGICRVRGCGVRHYGSGLCSAHELHYRQGRIDKNGKLLPSVCTDCGRKFPRTPQRTSCDRCRRVHRRIYSKLNRDYHLGYIDRQGRPLPFICQQCGRKFRRQRKTRFCETCAAARPDTLRRQRTGI